MDNVISEFVVYALIKFDGIIFRNMPWSILENIIKSENENINEKEARIILNDK